MGREKWFNQADEVNLMEFSDMELISSELSSESSEGCDSSPKGHESDSVKRTCPSRY